MATKLKLAFQDQQSTLLLKAFIFAGSLGLVKLAAFNVFSVLFFLVVAGIIYNKPLIHTFAHLASYITLVIVALALSAKLVDVPILVLFYIATALLCYVLLGIKNLFFIYRGELRYFVQLFLSYLLFILFFSADKSNYFSLKLFGVFVVLLLIWREFFTPPKSERKEKMSDVDKRLSPALTSGVVSLLVTEVLWAISVLPLSILSSASLALLAQFIVSDIVFRYIKATLTRRGILIYITIFILLTLLIFATTNWSI